MPEANLTNGKVARNLKFEMAELVRGRSGALVRVFGNSDEITVGPTLRASLAIPYQFARLSSI